MARTSAFALDLRCAGRRRAWSIAELGTALLGTKPSCARLRRVQMPCRAIPDLLAEMPVRQHLAKVAETPSRMWNPDHSSLRNQVGERSIRFPAYSENR